MMMKREREAKSGKTSTNRSHQYSSVMTSQLTTPRFCMALREIQRPYFPKFVCAPLCCHPGIHDLFE